MQKWILLLSGLLASSSVLAQSVTKIESFSPIGDVSSTEQVRLKFSEFMIEIGTAAKAADPMTTTCAALGKGRWLDAKEWVFNFDKRLPPRTQCDFKFKPGLKSVKGYPLVNPPVYTITITPAAILETAPSAVKDAHYLDKQNGDVDPNQAFAIHFTGKVTNEEILERLYFQVEGQKDKTQVKIEDPKLLKLISTEGRYYMDQSSKTETWVLISPKTEFPNQENLLVSLRDRQSSEILYYKTRPFFKAEFTCMRDNVRAPCSPVQTIDVVFNSPVSKEDIQKIKITGPTTAFAKINDTPTQQSSHEEHAIFSGPLKAGSKYKVEIPKGIKDIRGRSLKNISMFPLEFSTDGLPAVAKFPAAFGVLEAQTPVLPLSIRNIEKTLEIKSAEIVQFSAPEHAPDILNWLDRVQRQGSRSYGEQETPNGRANDFKSVFQKYSKEVKGKTTVTQLPALGEKNQAEVVGIPLTKKGFQIVEVQSKVLGKRILDREMPLYTSAAVLLTNLGIHFKWGQSGPSLVWVTELSTGKPVEGADIKIEACNGKVVASGKTTSDGTLTIAKLPSENEVAKQFGCNYDNYQATKLVVLAKKDDDFSFLLNSWDQGIESWRFNIGRFYEDTEGQFKDISAHTVLARDLLKPGQVVHMKHYFREFHWQGFKVPKKLPQYVNIVHLGSGQSWSLPVKFNSQGIATTQWTIPESANLGQYSILLSYSKSKDNQKQTGSFQVQEFRLPTLNVTMKVPDPITADTKDTKIALQGKYISGGPSGGLPIQLRFQRKAPENHSRILGDYLITQDEALTSGILKNNTEQESEFGEGGDGENPVATEKANQDALLTSKLTQKINLDAAGSAYVDLPKEVLNTDQDAEVMIALNYTDPNGEIQTSIRSTSVFSRDRYLGIHKDTKSYLNNPEKAEFELMLATPGGKGVANENMQVDVFQNFNYVHRTKLVGGFYGYHTTTERKKVAELCSGKTNEVGKFTCRGNFSGPGEYQLQANAKDSKGRALILVQNVWVYGSSETSGQSDSDRLTLIPDHEEYSAEGTAQISIQSPFQKFTALVTLERGGVVDHFIRELSADKPVISVPIKPEFSPNVVVSVLAVRGRVADPAPTGLLDLAKPAYKLGMVSLKIGKEAHQLPIKVTADKTLYQVRDTAQITIESKPNAEIALAVVDQALLKLHPNATWNLLDEMITFQNHRVNTSTLQMNLIGKRHFGKKATPFGGGGGSGITRELLDSLVAWKPNLKVGADGKLVVPVKLNDSISSFSVIAIGSEGMNLYGSGKTEIAASQDLQIISSVPPTMREEDRLPLQFILRNTTPKPLEVTAQLKIGKDDLAPQSLTLGAYSSQAIKWDYTIAQGISSLPIQLDASSKEGPKDSLKTTSKIVEVTPVFVIDGYLTQLTEKTTTLPVQFPKEALPGKGGYRLLLQPHLSDIPPSLLTYLQKYQYNCFEQQASRAIGLNDVKAWKKLMSNAKAYLDSNSLIKFFPEMRYGSVDLTAYILLLSTEAAKFNPGFALSTKGAEGALTARLVEALKKAMRGEIHIAQTWWPNYVAVNDRITAAEAVAEFEPIALADYEALKSIYTKNDLNHLLSLIHILKLSGPTLQNSMGDLNRFSQEVASQLHYENTHLSIKDSHFWFFGSLGESPDALKARLLLYFVGQNNQDDATKMLRTLTEDAKHGYFDTTPGDAWAVVAFSQYKNKYEKTPVFGTLTASLGKTSQKVEILEKSEPKTIFMPIGEVKDEHNLNQTFAGKGSPWSFTQVEAAIPITTEIDHGLLVRKKIEILQTAEKGKFKTGDLYKVHLTFEGKTPQGWIALSDPIPTGASIIDSESKNTWIAFAERRMDRMQVFFEYLAPGQSEFTYTVRLNQSGEFQFPPTRIEAMYDPTQYGEAPNAKMVVQP